LGRHSKPSRLRISHRLPSAAAPALAGVAAAFYFAPQALADPSTASTVTTSHAVTADASSSQGFSAQLLAAIEQTTQKQASTKQASSQPPSYTVKSGDTLSAIAQREYRNQAAWPVLYYANRNTIKWANVIEPGQVLKVPAEPTKIPHAPGQLGPEASPVSAPAPAAQAYTPSASTATQATSSTATYSGGTPGGSFGACVVARESGGNSQVMNSSGHYGLYQFSASTWEEYGGSGADFGNASAAEQNQVFANALAAGGQSNWSAYDGC
jgi:LysM repeat protein